MNINLKKLSLYICIALIIEVALQGFNLAQYLAMGYFSEHFMIEILSTATKALLATFFYTFGKKLK